jgi:putative oxidoreductase
MHLFLPLGNDYALLVGRCLLAVVFAISAVSKLQRNPAELKVIASLHIPAPASVEVLVGICEVIGALALVLGVFVRIASILLALFLIGISFTVLTFWSSADPPPVRAQKLNNFAANASIVGGLVYVIAAGAGRFSLMQ